MSWDERAVAWWQRGVIYQIYPRSFQDTNGDGVGDLNGITARLDHLAWLGVDALWVSPIYPSPMADFGYDVSDYCAIDPLFGTMADFDRLVAQAHQRGLKVILDFVPNHTSDQHPWFVESRSSKDNPKRDWYLWREPKPDGAPPNNWIANFGGPAWTFDARTGQSYYHAFLSEQPDLNWRHPEVRAAMYDALRFWLKRGVDGFRVDAIANLIEDALLREDPPNPDFHAGLPPNRRVHRVFSYDRPETHPCVADLRAVIDEFPDRVVIGEAHLPIARVVKYYGDDRPGFNLPFNFILLHNPVAHALERGERRGRDRSVYDPPAQGRLAQRGARQP
jgi:alpha-glucosidase